MKRHKSLIPLSQDHHHGLLLSQLIKKGAPEYKDLPNDIEGKAEYVKESWNNELKLHFENEEKILFPFVQGKNDALDNLISEIIDEHIKIKKLVKELDYSENKEETLNKLGVLLENHIRKEERILFPQTQTLLGIDLDKLEGKINPVKNTCKT